jgi:26S proteasome regulatory subunit (ATPase 3-interacting protein)
MLSSISSLEHEKSGIVTRLESLKAGSAKKVTTEEREEVEKGCKKMKGIMERREKIAGEFFAMVKEGTEGAEALEELREGWGMND